MSPSPLSIGDALLERLGDPFSEGERDPRGGDGERSTFFGDLDGERDFLLSALRERLLLRDLDFDSRRERFGGERLRLFERLELRERERRRSRLRERLRERLLDRERERPACESSIILIFLPFKSIPSHFSMHLLRSDGVAKQRSASFGLL